MVSATVFFGLAAIFGHDSFKRGDVTAGQFVLTVVGFGLLTLGGWLGGSVVFVHGMRVLNLVEEPAGRSPPPPPEPEKEGGGGPLAAASAHTTSPSTQSLFDTPPGGAA